MKFNSQICTTREQSERLLALGLKKETADMHWYKPAQFEHDYWFEGIGQEWSENDIPAWSLHRLWELSLINSMVLDDIGEIAKIYDCVIDNIESQIKEGYFNKEYLV